MKKALKTTGRILLGLLILITVFISGLFLYNKAMLKKEAPLREPLGQIVEIDGHNMCVYNEGDGYHTLVFLSGSGTPSPILDFKSLYDLLKDECRIVVIEKFGYGFSDVVDSERSFDTMLRQDREALSKLGIDGPFILCPHSMSGLEALQWAQEYPDEVEAIVGLDMALPAAYDVLDLKEAERLETLSGLAVKLGFLRIVDLRSMYPAFTAGTLTDHEKDIYMAISRDITCNKDIILESKSIPETCQKINSRSKPDVPTLILVSDGNDLDVPGWREIQHEYAQGLSDVYVKDYDCGHYLHNIVYNDISDEMKRFINHIDSIKEENK